MQERVSLARESEGDSMKSKGLLLAASAAFVWAAIPAQAQVTPGPWEMPTGGDLSATLDCLEAAERTVISAHRGGPSPG